MIIGSEGMLAFPIGSLAIIGGHRRNAARESWAGYQAPVHLPPFQYKGGSADATAAVFMGRP